MINSIELEAVVPPPSFPAGLQPIRFQKVLLEGVKRMTERITEGMNEFIQKEKEATREYVKLQQKKQTWLVFLRYLPR